MTDRPAIQAISRREVLTAGAGIVCSSVGDASPVIDSPIARRRAKRVAGITTAYFHNSHADVILSRLLQGEDLDYHSRRPDLELVSLYVDQFPANDISRSL